MVQDPMKNPAETLNRPSLEFPKRPRQDTNTIFSVHVASLREVSTRSMFQACFGSNFSIFHRILHHPKSEMHYEIVNLNPFLCEVCV